MRFAVYGFVTKAVDSERFSGAVGFALRQAGSYKVLAVLEHLEPNELSETGTILIERLVSVMGNNLEKLKSPGYRAARSIV
jgi:hypothetical protein